MFSYDLSKLSFGRAIFLIMLCFSGIIAPLWFIFQFSQSLFFNTELIKLLLISLAIGIPLLTLNFFSELLIFYAYDLDDTIMTEEKHFRLLTNSMISVIIVLYAPILKSFFSYSSLNTAISQGVATQFFLLLFDVKRAIKAKRRIEKSKNKKEVQGSQEDSVSTVVAQHH